MCIYESLLDDVVVRKLQISTSVIISSDSNGTDQGHFK